jgi:glycosyltransferase involved in cell wall biosynthesis
MKTGMRVAVIGDLTEETWPSMDLVADMLYAHLKREPVDVSLVRPKMVRRFSRDGDGRGKRYTADRLTNRLWDYPRSLARLRGAFDVFHIVDHSYSQLVHALPPERTVITCHDLDTFRSVLEPRAEPRSWPFRVMTRQILAGFRKAARIVCDSEATSAALRGHRLVPEERVVVAPLGLHPAFLDGGGVGAGRAIERLLGAKDGRLEMLHVGSTIPRKRIDVLLDVVHEIRRRVPGTRLVRVGGDFTVSQHERLSRLGLEDGVSVLPPLEWDEVAAMYRRADVVLLTSEREGFGLPVLEALACGTPVIASDIPALRETGGSVAIYCPVGDVQAWVAAVLAHRRAREPGDPALMIERQERIAHAGKFGWADYASRMVEVYRDVLAAGGS